MQINSVFVKKIVYITSFFFLITGIALAVHPHDLPPQFTGCKICNVKIPFTGTPYKNAKDCSLAVAVGCGRLLDMLPVTPELICDVARRAPSSIALLTYLNKSPPPHLT